MFECHSDKNLVAVDCTIVWNR